jgi:hypothetical protein
VSETDLRAFEDAGWQFHEKPAEPPENAVQAKVFIKPRRRLALSTNRLTVKLPDDPSEEQANAVLQPFGCRVEERFTFAPGLFQIILTDQAQGDSVEVANQLTDSGSVEFAEPVLIEAIGGRVG